MLSCPTAMRAANVVTAVNGLSGRRLYTGTRMPYRVVVFTKKHEWILEMVREPDGLKGWLRAAWNDFSRMIRVESADGRGICQCVTCDRREHWSSGLMHAGHFLAYRYPNSPVRFSETNVHCQCSRCNLDGFTSIPHPGAVQKRESVQLRYMTYMIKKYGLEEIERLEVKRNTERLATGKERIEELRANRSEYKRRSNFAIEEKGL